MLHLRVWRICSQVMNVKVQLAVCVSLLMGLTLLTPMVHAAPQGELYALNCLVWSGEDGTQFVLEGDFPLGSLDIYNPDALDTADFPIYHVQNTYRMFDFNDTMDHFTLDIGSLWNWDNIEFTTRSAAIIEIPESNSATGQAHVGYSWKQLDKPYGAMMPDITLQPLPAPKLISIGDGWTNITWPTLDDPLGMILGYMVFSSFDNESFNPLTSTVDDSINGEGENKVWIQEGMNDGFNHAFFNHTSSHGSLQYYRITPVFWANYYPEVMSPGSSPNVINPDVLTIQASSILEPSIDIGSRNVPAVEFILDVEEFDDGSVVLNKLRMDLLGSLGMNYFESIRLHMDSDMDGYFDLELDQKLATGSLVDGMVIFINLKLQITSEDSVRLFLVFTLYSTVETSGENIGFSMSGANYLLLGSGDRIQATGFPFYSQIATITSDTLSLTPVNHAPSYALSEAEGVVFAMLTLNSDNTQNGNLILSELAFSMTGSAYGEFATVELWLDLDASNTLNPSDTLLATGELISPVLTFSNLGLSISYGSPIKLIICASFSAGTPNGDTFGMALESSSAITLGSPDKIDPSNLPFATSLATLYLDTDGDGLPNDMNGNGANDVGTEASGFLGDDLDDDDDGYNDEIEISCNTNPLDPSSVPPDRDMDFIPDQLDNDIDGDDVWNGNDMFPYDPSEWNDLDLDGVGDNLDRDDDEDGFLDELDAFPLDPDEWLDTDRDGVGDNSDWDKDGDGVSNINDTFPMDSTEWMDSDTDGLGDNCDLDRDGDGVLNIDDAFPDDNTEWLDTDSDGVGDNIDPDRDGDGWENSKDAFPDDLREWADRDNDGIGDNRDADRDGDGFVNSEDAFPNDPNEWIDSDSDGVGDNMDNDDDNDGMPDSVDAFPTDPSEWADLDKDGIGDGVDVDRDGDGATNAEDAFPDDKLEWQDTDGDGVGNNADSDDDDDGVSDPLDVFPLDPSEWDDTDGDGVGDNADLDRDNDGVLDEFDMFLWDPTEWSDTDGDGIGDNADPDRDGDGVPNEMDLFPLDKHESKDTDMDGIGDKADMDDDGDGFSDAEERNAGTNPLDSSSRPTLSPVGTIASIPAWIYLTIIATLLLALAGATIRRRRHGGEDPSGMDVSSGTGVGEISGTVDITSVEKLGMDVMEISSVGVLENLGEEGSAPGMYTAPEKASRPVLRPVQMGITQNSELSSFTCPNCGNGFSINKSASNVVVCPSCGIRGRI